MLFTLDRQAENWRLELMNIKMTSIKRAGTCLSFLNTDCNPNMILIGVILKFGWDILGKG